MSQVINESYLYEGLDRESTRTMRLWENAGRKLVEANLDAATIQKIFTAAEQGAAAGGNNRTLLGLGKDAATAVKAAYDDLANKIQNSGPVKDIDAKYDQAAKKLKAATGGDQGVMKYVQKYRDFAKAHPIAQSLIYSALIAAAGISGAGLGGAAALGLLKMTDKLLQGEKFSSAAYSGAKTGALAYGASQLGKAIKGGDNADSVPTNGSETDGSDVSYNYQGVQVAGQPVIPGQPLNTMQMGTVDMNIAQGNTPIPEIQKAYDLAKQAGVVSSYGPGPGGSWPDGFPDKVIKGLKAAGVAVDNSNSSNFESIDLTTSQLAEMFAAVTVTMVNEGLWDTVKKTAGQAVGAVANKAQQVGKNLTNKVTADKLNRAWTAAGSPTDSEQVKQVLITAGVPENVVADVYKKMKLTAKIEQPKLTVKQINQIIVKLRLRDLQSLQKTVNAALQKRQKTT